MDDKNVMDINFEAIGQSILRRLWVIILVGLIAGAAAFAYSSFLVTPLYTSNASMYIGDTTTGVSGGNVTVSDIITDDYKTIITKRTVLDPVIAELGLSMSADELEGCIAVTNPNGTRILDVGVTTSDPVRSKLIADKLCEVGAEKIKEIVKVDYVTVIDDGTLSDAPVNNNTVPMSILAALAGVFLSAFIVIVAVLMDDKIRTEEDVERYLGLSVLGSIPYMEPDKNSDGARG